MVEGRRYIAERVRTALFPTGARRVHDRARRSLRAMVEDRSVAAAGTRSTCSGTTASVCSVPAARSSLQTDPIAVRVRPLPAEGKPRTSPARWGSSTLAAEVDRTVVKAGDAITLTRHALRAGKREGHPGAGPGRSRGLQDLRVQRHREIPSRSTARSGDARPGSSCWCRSPAAMWTSPRCGSPCSIRWRSST